ncbi:MAG: RIP metalloprotease RseP [Acidobacteria bacterium]|nr:RIP metalloprotease RseP [Acidobacteriota bacterium]
MNPFLNPESLLAFALLLGPLVLIHELGHFTVAKLLGIKVEVFSIGFGPRLFGIRRGDTDYRLSLLPLGGYVKMLGENPDENLQGDPREFLSRPKRERLAVLFMGPITNILAALIIMAGVYQAGIPEPAYLSRPAIVGAVDPDSPAAKAGVSTGDRILRFGNHPIKDWNDLQTKVAFSPGQSVSVVLERGGETLTKDLRLESVTDYQYGYAGIFPEMPAQILQVEPGLPADKAGLKAADRVVKIDGEPIVHFERATRLFQQSAGKPLALGVRRGNSELSLTVVPVEEEGKGRLGIAWNLAAEEAIRKYPLTEALVQSAQWNWDNAGLLFTTLGKLLTAQISPRMMSGPIDIFKISGQQFQEGWTHFFLIMSLVSLQLGVINLLPFPVLDGGHILIICIEGLMRRELSLKIKERVMQTGFYLLIGLMGAIIYLDIAKNSGLLRDALQTMFGLLGNKSNP